MRIALSLALGGLMLAGGAVAEPQGNRAEGRKLAGQCRTCHGLDGLAQIPIAPHIGGESEAYIRTQLAAFRDGTREHEMMSIVAKTLTDQQIADLAAWYGSHRVTATLQADPAAAPEQCIACHGTDGIRQIDEAPNLAGETNIYIDTQLKAFRSGARQSDMMSPIASDMNDEEIRAVADWFSEVKIKIDLVE
ncbi:c-type cytochrome [Paracoccus sp. MBLB3053]|uniref:C-type cytochrome n=1 Tax=Paracoccus aurantius TaxID=3073814 RepID=A0ABU2HWI2_9RHOB|nr:c-type cytochrome [Paracoccus sp. MBLB3053]MDS9469403.1 c-type cytochrome [Paracoccus sp. MBLB3053]